WQEATDGTLLGEEELPTGKAWHVKATSRQGNAFEAWVRKSDGYLLRYFATSKSGNTTFTYSMDRFNSGVTIDAPPASEVSCEGGRRDRGAEAGCRRKEEWRVKECGCV